MSLFDIKGRDALSATAVGGSAGGMSPWIQGDWTMNVGGSGTSLQAASGSPAPVPTWLIVVAVAGAAWCLLRRK